MRKADHRGDDRSAASGEEERGSNASWDVNHGIENGVQPGSLLGPITGLGFSADGGLLFSCSGSSLSVFDVRSGALLSTVRVLPPGVAVYGLDIGRGSVGVVFGDRCVSVVSPVPSAADLTVSYASRSPRRRYSAGGACDREDKSVRAPSAALSPPPAAAAAAAVVPPSPPHGSSGHAAVDSASVTTADSGRDCTRCAGGACVITEAAGPGEIDCGWFRSVARLPGLRDRVWDARLVEGGISSGGGRKESRRSRDEAGEEGGGEKDEDRRRHWRGDRPGLGLVAVALAHNTVEVWDWTAPERPARVSRSCGGHPCLLYHARLWGRTLGDLRVACGTAFNQVLVWRPGWGDTSKQVNPGCGPDESGVQADSHVLRLDGHEGVIFRVSWRDDGKRLASVSDDRTVRVWDVSATSASLGAAIAPARSQRSDSLEGIGDAAAVGRLEPSKGRLLATGWGHASRVWDAAFTDVGIVTAGEDSTVILWRETEPRPKRPSAAPSNHERLLAPAATLRGHPGSHVWRLAVHHHHRASSVEDDDCSRRRGGGRWRRGKGGGDPEARLVVLASGGNDGGCKLWDLAFEAARERRPPRKGSGRRFDALWGETYRIPYSPHTPLDPANHGLTAKSSASPGARNTLLDEAEAEQGRSAPRRRRKPPFVREIRLFLQDELLRAAVVLLADGSVWWVSDLALGPWEPVVEPPSPLGVAPAARVSHQCGIIQSQAEAEGSHDGSDAYFYGDKESAAAGVTAACAVQSRVTRNEGRAGTPADDGVGPVAMTAPRRGPPPVSMPSAAVSAVVVLGTRRRCCYSDAPARNEDDVAQVFVVVGREDGSMFLLAAHPASPVASCTSTSSKAPDSCFPRASEKGSDGSGCSQPDQSPRPPRPPWRIAASWKGHPGSRVTSLWVINDATSAAASAASFAKTNASCASALGNPGGDGGAAAAAAGREQVEEHSIPFIAALDTSRLSRPQDDGRPCPHGGGAAFDGVLISAGADGTVAWWEWPGYVEREGASILGDGGRAQAPALRMVCHAGLGSGATTAAITSVAIDDRRRLRLRRGRRLDHHSRDHDFDPKDDDTRDPRRPKTSTRAGSRALGGERNETRRSFRGGESTGAEPEVGAGAVVFCGDTKGNIRCFVEKKSEEKERGKEEAIAAAGSGSLSPTRRSTPRKRDGGGAGRRSSMEGGVSPCLVLKRQHGKDQISRLALRGDCLFSAGHDGNVNQYVITYPRPGRRDDASDTIEETRGVSGDISGGGRESAAAGDPEAFSPTGLPMGDDAPPEKHQLRQRQEQRQPPVVLTLVTCHAAAPITAISDLWVGGGRGLDVGEVRGTGQGGAPGLRLAVAGRSGRSTMSLWDLTEGRQLLELDCGDRHLPQDLAVLWRPPETPLRQKPCSRAAGFSSSSISSTCHDRRHHHRCYCCGDSHAFRRGSSLPTCGGLGLRGTGTPLPLHTFAAAVAAPPEPSNKTTVAFPASKKADDEEEVGNDDNDELEGEVDSKPSILHEVSPALRIARVKEGVGGGCGRSLGSDAADGAGDRTGVFIRFHSTIVGDNAAGWNRGRAAAVARRLQRHRVGEEDGATTDGWTSTDHTIACGVPVRVNSSTGAEVSIPGQGKVENGTGVTVGRALTVGAEAFALGGNKKKPDRGDGPGTAGSPRAASDGGGGERGWDRESFFALTSSFRFGYSLAPPFHRQRVTCVKFLPPPQPGPAPRSGDGERSGLRLVTGGEDGMVRVLDAFYGRDAAGTAPDPSPFHPCRVDAPNHPLGDPTPVSSPPSSSSTATPALAAHRSSTRRALGRRTLAKATVVQALPRHESSVGALAAAALLPAPGEGTDHANPRVEMVIASGGGKMELRAWCLESSVGGGVGDGDRDGDGAGGSSEADAVPPVRWLLTTTPAPRSPLHAHRILCLCVLPPPSASPSPEKTAQNTVLISGDSGGGVTVFETPPPSLLRRPSSSIAEEQALRSRPAGRWMASAERPVLCVAHVRMLVAVQGRGGGAPKRKLRSEPLPTPFPPRASRECQATRAPPAAREICHPITSSENPDRDEAAPTCGGRLGGGGGARGFSFGLRENGGGDGVERVAECPLAAETESESRDGRKGEKKEEAFLKGKEALDFVVTGDTSGTVTVWRFLYGEGEDSSDGDGPPMLPTKTQEGGFVHRGPEGRRRGGGGKSVRTVDEAVPPARLVSVLEYRAHQMGVLCVATHALKTNESFLIVTGGDDQALCVAEIDVSTVAVTSRETAVRFSEEGGAPSRMDGAAGSAIKGVVVLPSGERYDPHSAALTGESPALEHGDRNHGSPLVGAILSVFTAARDQRLSRWDLVEEVLSPPPYKQQQQREGTGASPGGANDNHQELPSRESSSTRKTDGDRGQRTNEAYRDTRGARDVRMSNGSAAAAGEAFLSEDAWRRRRRRRWRFVWRAGCVTDVCDVSGMDAVALPSPWPGRPSTRPEGCGGPRGKEGGVREARDGVDPGHRVVGREGEELLLSPNPPALVAVCGQGLQLVRFDADCSGPRG